MRFLERPLPRLRLIAVFFGVVILLLLFVVGMKIRTMVPGNALYWMNDFDMFSKGGRAVLDKSPLYGYITSYGYHFPATPFAALWCVPFALMPILLGQVVWFTLSLCALAGCCWICFRMMGVVSGKACTLAAVVAACCAMVLDPVLDNQFFGQINIFVMLLVLLDVAPGLPRRLRGVFTGIAAGVILTPLLFIMFYLVARKVRMAFKAGIAFVATIVLGSIVVPGSFSSYWIKAEFFRAPISGMSDTDVMHSLEGFFARTLGTPAHLPTVGYVFAALVAVFGLIQATMAYRKGHLLLGVILIGNTTLLVSPVTWMATMVWIVPTLVWAGLAVWRRQPAIPAALGFALAAWSTIPVYWLAQRVGDPTPYQTTVTGNLIATLGSPMFPLFLGVMSSPLWVGYLSPASSLGKCPGRVVCQRPADQSHRPDTVCCPRHMGSHEHTNSTTPPQPIG